MSLGLLQWRSLESTSQSRKEPTACESAMRSVSLALAAAGLLAVLVQSSPSHEDCAAAAASGCGACLAVPGCAFCAHDGSAASFVPDDLSGLWRFKQQHTHLSFQRQRSRLLASQHSADGKDARLDRHQHHDEPVAEDETAFVEVGAAGGSAHGGFCYSIAAAEQGVAPKGAESPVTKEVLTGQERWVCLDARDRRCDCEEFQGEFSCSAPRSAARLAVVGLFIAFCVAVAAAGCMWAGSIDVGAWFPRSSREGDYLGDQVATADEAIELPRSGSSGTVPKSA
jgi:hypothetical protein